MYSALALDSGGAAVLAVMSVKPVRQGANPQNDEQLEGEYLKRESGRRDRGLSARHAAARKDRAQPHSLFQ